ncbi:MAG: DMT family transporter [Chloroflexi bacterium]|nr:DMT family transporter [Chloroflexota bacterium]
MDRRRALGIALIVTSAAGFGSAAVLAAPVYATGVDWLELVLWRFLIGSLLAWTWILVSARRRAAVRRLSRRQIAAAIALGTLYTGNAGTYYAGLETVPAALAGILVYTYPVIVALLSIRFATRLHGRRPWIALVLALLGVALAVGSIDVATAPPVLGLALVMISPVIYSVWIILAARLSGERSDRLGHEASGMVASDAAVTTAIMISATAAGYLVASFVSGRAVGPGAIPSAAWPGLLAIAFLSSFLAIQTFYAGSRRIGAAQAALVSTVEPVITVVLAWLVLSQGLEPLQFVGGALILVGVVLSQTAPRGSGVAKVSPAVAPR